MRYRVSHVTRVTYDSPVRLARFNLRLRPAEWPGQVVSGYRLLVDPRPAAVASGSGPFVVNRSHLLIREPLTELVIDSSFDAEVAATAVTAGDPGPALAGIRADALTVRDLSPLGPASYVFDSPLAGHVGAIAEWAAAAAGGETGAIAFGRALCAATHNHFAYDPGTTDTRTTPAEAFAAARGVCQDFAQVMIVAARALGVPAAYVSGYLRTLPPPGMPRLIGADAMHAWVALWCGEALGRVGFDPTNDRLVDADYIFVGMGRDYSDVAPIDGVFVGGGGQEMDVAVDVAEVSEAAEAGAVGAA